MEAARNASRERILIAARQLMARRRPAEVEREQVARAAGISPQEFDLHFDDMTRLWRSVADTMVSDMVDIQRSLYEMPCSVPDRLSRALTFALDYFEQDPDGFQAVRRMLDAPGPAGEHARGMVKGILTEVTCQLGVIRGWDAEPELTTQCLFAQLLRIFDHWLAHPDRMTRARVERFVVRLLGLRERELEVC